MEEHTIKTLFIILIAALPCGIFGHLIAFKGRRGLISGFNEKSRFKPYATFYFFGVYRLL